MRSKVCACSSTTAISRFHMICSSISPIGLDIGCYSFGLQACTPAQYYCHNHAAGLGLFQVKITVTLPKGPKSAT